jgi:2-polyprenyl-6-methoxyphenol hydroxylase-like FAD-dependent oxidoreductase
MTPILRSWPIRRTGSYPTIRAGLANVEVDTGASAGDHPVTVTVERIDDEHKGQNGETVERAKYVVGCDGARSAVRTSMGRTNWTGDAAHQAWGVMDILAVTGFPRYSHENRDPVGR